MGFQKREVAENFISLGDGEGDVQKVGGILTRFVQNTHFAKPKTDYEYIDKDGQTQLLSGSASLSRQIHSEDIGKFFKAEFEGWGKSANGAFKKIAVYIWEGEPTDVMKAWPRFGEFFGRTAVKSVAAAVSAVAQATAEKIRDDFDEMPAAIAKGQKTDDDDLPF